MNDSAAPLPYVDPAERVRVELAERSYDILIGRGLIGDPASFSGSSGSRAFVISNEIVAPIYGDRLRSTLAEAGWRNPSLFVLADGEATKTWHALQAIFDHLLAERCDRAATLFALGGGVIGDLTGFAAACLMRGISFVQVPTTLLAQVDSSVGGKTGINHPLGKNMIGAFHQPARVVIDTDVLATLPHRELVAGVAEIIKYGAIADDAFLAWLEAHVDDLLALEPNAVRHAIRRSCEIKASVVAADEREADVRAILNFGHTFGHAIEAGLGFGRWLHGEAVGCGMVMAAALSARLGFIEPAHAERIARLIERTGLPVRGPALSSGRYLELMQSDKKAARGAVRHVVLRGPGRAGLATPPVEAVEQVLNEYASAPA